MRLKPSEQGLTRPTGVGPLAQRDTVGDKVEFCTEAPGPKALSPSACHRPLLSLEAVRSAWAMPAVASLQFFATVQGLASIDLERATFHLERPSCESARQAKGSVSGILVRRMALALGTHCVWDQALPLSGW